MLAVTKKPKITTDRDGGMRSDDRLERKAENMCDTHMQSGNMHETAKTHALY